jgi:hypothetical protein
LSVYFLADELHVTFSSEAQVKQGLSLVSDH